MTQTLVIDYQQEGQEQDCPAMYVEVPENQVQAGDEVEIRLWGPLHRLQGWSLCVFDQSLGVGELQQLQNPEFTQQVDLPEKLDAQLEYPMDQLTRVKALTPLAFIPSDRPYPPEVWKQRGQVITAHCSRKGYSCVQVNHDLPLYGSLEVTYQRIATYLRWFWTIPADTYGDIWFFLYDDIDTTPYRKFAVELPALASVQQEPRNLSIRTMDFATEASVPNAAIYLDGQFQGRTDAQGVLHLSNIMTGRHSFRAEASGYLSTDVDSLSNETIVVK